MKSLLVLSTLIFAQIAQASVVEAWAMNKPKVSPSFLTKADGTKIPVDPTEEVIIDLKFVTVKTYGQAASRKMTSKNIVLPNGAEQGLIEVTIENEQDGDCTRRSSGYGYISMMGRQDASLKIVGKIGEYKVRINSIDAGILNVAATDAKYDVNAEEYVKKINEAEVAKFQEVFGPMGMPEIRGDKECSAIPREVGDGVVYDYIFPSYQTPGPEEGDIIIKKEVSGSMNIKSFDMNLEANCKDRKYDTYEVEFTDSANPKAKLKMIKRMSGYAAATFTYGGTKTCWSKK